MLTFEHPWTTGLRIQHTAENLADRCYISIICFSESLQSTVVTKHAYVNILTRGDLSSLTWLESPLKHFSPADHPEKELCSVHYASLNFRDIMLATGKLPPDAIPGDLASQECILGMEFAGRNSSGERVMGLLPAKAIKLDIFLF